jgi:hypothetical protein
MAGPAFHRALSMAQGAAVAHATAVTFWARSFEVIIGFMRGLLAVCVVAGAFGCAGMPQMTAVDLAGRAERNMIEAQQNLAGRMVIVRGVVKDTTLASRDRVELVGGWGRYSSATAVKREEQIPLVVMEPGSVLCYFEPEHIGDVANIQAGHSVELECEVQSFRHVQGMSVSVLAGCRSNGK